MHESKYAGFIQELSIATVGMLCNRAINELILFLLLF